MKKDDLKNYEESIRNYGDKIESIDSFVEAVRNFPGMYIGAKGNVGWKACIREIFQNSVDEIVREESPCHYVKLTFDERDQSAIIEDTGRGIPHNKMIDIYARQHTSSNYTKELYQYTSGVHGVGAGVAMALSRSFDSISYVLGEARHVHFDSGILWSDMEKVVECPEGRQGTTVMMSPDLSVLDEVNLTCEEILDLVLKIYPLINIGDQIDFMGIDKDGRIKFDEKLVNKDGIITSLILRTQTPLVTPIYFKDDNGTMRGEIAFTYDSSDLTSDEDIVSYANFTPTTGGTHVDGFRDGLCQFFRNYMNKIYLGEKSKISVINNDIRTGLKVIINSAHLEPVFAGQFKGILSNSDMQGFIKNLTITSLDNWSKTSPNDLQKVCKFIKEIAEIRVKSDDSKIKLSNNYSVSHITGKPKKYYPPSENKNLELIIVEGDSAMGSAKLSRDSDIQGLFPIRGKLPNAFKEPKAKFLSNAEVSAIITIIGCGYGKNMDISKCKFKKIIFLPDADPDGSHIATLLLRFFLMYMPALIEAGMVYKSVAPLFSVKVKGKLIYFTTKLDFTKYVQNLFTRTHNLSNINGNRLSKSDATTLFFINIDYKDTVEYISNTFAINPKLLETIVYYLSECISVGKPVQTIANVKQPDGVDGEIPLAQSAISTFSYQIKHQIDIKKLSAILKKNKLFRFINLEQVNNIIKIEGLVDSKYNYVFINDKFIISCLPLIKILNDNMNLYYQIDGKTVSLYDLMLEFDRTIPSGLTRYKGLGEQNSQQLGVSALHPKGDRTLIRYTIESAKEEIENFRRIDSNIGSLLRDISVTKVDIE